MRYLLTLLPLLYWPPVFAQLPYTQTQFALREEKNISYGTVTTFAGQQETLALDLYKPVGDQNCRRPLLVMVHGGAWIAGSRTDADAVAVAREMARKGYVVASISYRLGSHKLGFYTPYALCNDQINLLGITKCVYGADSAEAIRAAYRAMQDAKGAIRFLKGRHSLDSTDVNNVFVAGVSAGGFTAMLTGYMDLASEKPIEAGALANAPTPDADLVSCLPGGYSLTRPDLGPVEGTLNVNNGYDASVKGVGNFYGGVFSNLFSSPNPPLLYLYHQRKDVVVACDYKPLLGEMYARCINPINLCQPLTNMPKAYGSCGIADLIRNGGALPAWVYDDIDQTGQPDCLANPPGHSIINLNLRCQNLADFWAPAIAASGNQPNPVCATSTEPLATLPGFRFVFDQATLELHMVTEDGKSASWELTTIYGAELCTGNTLTESTFSLAGLPGGVYLLRVRKGSSEMVQRLIR